MKKVLMLIACIFISACSLNAPKYQPSADNNNLLQDLTSKKIAVGKFNERSAEVNNLSLRGGNLISPYNNSYSVYLSKALEEELMLAGLLDKNAGIQISGTLVDNQLDISGFSIGTASITVKFVVKRNNKIVFDKKLTTNHQWESSFMGGIAIPAGQNNYPVVIQKLFNTLFKDKSFMTAVK